MGFHLASGRAVIGILVAASVALLPIFGGFAVASSEQIVTSAHHCCDDMDMPAQTPMGMKDCQSSAGCAYKCFSLYVQTFSGPAVQPSPSEQLYPPLVRATYSIQISPPLHPPRA